MREIIQQYGDCTLRELVMKYVDAEIDRLLQGSQENLRQLGEELMKDVK